MILQENGIFSWFSDHNTLSFGWDSFFVAESNLALQCASDKVQWTCLLWPADFIDPFYTKSSHSAFSKSLFFQKLFCKKESFTCSMFGKNIVIIFLKLCWQIESFSWLSKDFFLGKAQDMKEATKMHKSASFTYVWEEDSYYIPKTLLPD